jgi:hypothetical protein
MKGAVVLLSHQPAVGIVFTIIACFAFVVWDYIRRKEHFAESGYLLAVRWVAVAAAFLSVLLMASRFVTVWFLS